ncbi:hypothetical protein DPMN_013230 [Dreissena polymorpha]|uniref:Uncharacterized protein n=1 Tax=Dreissena polymorpha TaxID=45954 RepID=A0A9D4N7J1_DREPO|nr:hypothetical protein DPMN_013230 [Dreissena polymorpha]
MRAGWLAGGRTGWRAEQAWCVQSNGQTRTDRRKDVETEVAKWLAGAKDQEGGRKKRNKTPQSQPEAQAAENAQSD